MIAVGTVGCVSSTTPEPRLPALSSVTTNTSGETSSVQPDTWCSPVAGVATHTLVLDITPPGGKGPTRIELPAVECADVKGAILSSPSACMNADSMEPRAWFNGCVTLRAVSENSATADLNLSWHHASGVEGECTESITISLAEQIRVIAKCGVAVAAHFHRLAGLSNSRIKLPVRSVTAVACATVAPDRPAAYAVRWADKSLARGCPSEC